MIEIAPSIMPPAGHAAAAHDSAASISPAAAQGFICTKDPPAAPSDDQLRAASDRLRHHTNEILAAICDPELNAAARRLRGSVLECVDALVRLRGAFEHEARSRQQLQRAVGGLRAQLAQSHADMLRLVAESGIDDRLPAWSPPGIAVPHAE